MTDAPPADAMITFDAATRALVRLAARIAAGTEQAVRDGIAESLSVGTSPVWLDEVILQSYLFAGFPRTLNAAREYRKAQGGSCDGAVLGMGQGTPGADYRAMGEATCRRVYGKFYEKLRHNIAELHPELDDWMIVEGYGKVLSRPALDLGRRELCVIAACVAAGQDRQLHSHLHGARNVGVADAVVDEALSALDGVVDGSHLERAVLLWARVKGK